MKLVHRPQTFNAYRDEKGERLVFDLDPGYSTLSNASQLDGQVRELRKLARTIAAVRKELYPTTKERT